MGEGESAHRYDVSIDNTRGVVIGDHNLIFETIVRDYPDLRDHICDFSDILTSSTQWFVGRESVFDRLAIFRQDHSCGYFCIEAQAGLGKTALAAEIARSQAAPVFFVSASRGLTRPSQFLSHLCADLIARFELDHDHLPVRAGIDSGFLTTLIVEAVRGSSRPLLLVVDGLDEADEAQPGCNPLLLPTRLPERTYIVFTQRPGAPYVFTEPHVATYHCAISSDAPEQRRDIERYLARQATENAKLARLLRSANPPIGVDGFVANLADASQGNFMYLEYILADILSERAPVLPDRGALPRGLEGYYWRFWKPMSGIGQDEGWTEWNRLYRPVLECLSIAGEPVTTRWLADQIGADAYEIRDRALSRWQRFLARENGPNEEHWFIVHQSFAEFVRSQVGAERIRAAHQTIARWHVDPSHWLAHGRYALRHLSNHLVAAGCAEDLFGLIEDPLWYETQSRWDPSGQAYLADVSRAWAYVDALDDAATGTGLSPPGLALEAECALATATAHSFSDNVPVALLKALLRTGTWAPAQARAAALQTPDEVERAVKLLSLLPHLEEAARTLTARDGVAAARMIGDATRRAELIRKFVGDIPKPVMHDVLELARTCSDQLTRARLTCDVARYLPSSMRTSALREVVDLARAQNDYEIKAQLLMLVASAPDAPVDETIMAASVLPRVLRAEVIVELLPAVSDAMRGSLLFEILEAARDAASPRRRTSLYVSVMRHVEEPQRSNIAHAALEAMRKVAGASRQARLLGQLVPYQLDAEAPAITEDLVEAVLESAGGMRDLALQPDLLVAVAPHMSALQLETALGVAEEVRDGGWRAQLLTGIAPFLSEDKAARALEAIRYVDDDDRRSMCLVTLIRRLPEHVIPDAINACLDSNRRKPEIMGVASLRLIDINTPSAVEVAKSLARQALASTRRIGDRPHLVQALAWLADHLTPPQLERVLSSTHLLADQAARTDALRRLLPHLPPGLVRETLKSVHGVVDESSRLQLLAVVAPYLSQDEHADAISIARQMTKPELRVAALIGLAPLVCATYRKELLHEALHTIAAIGDEERQVRLLRMVAQRLPAEAHAHVLELISALRDGDRRAEALTEVAPLLEGSDALRALAIAEQVEIVSRADILTSLAPALPPQVLSDVLANLQEGLHRALDEARGIESEDYRAQRIIELGPNLPEALLAEAIELIGTIEHSGIRAEALVELAALLEDPPRSEVLERALVLAESTSDEARRAHLLVTVASQLPDDLFPDALTLAQKLSQERLRAQVLTALSQHAPSDLLVGLVEIARGVRDAAHKLSVLAAVLTRALAFNQAPFLLEPVLDEAILTARAVRDQRARAFAFATLAAHASASRRGLLIAEAFEYAARLSPGERAGVLDVLVREAGRLSDEGVARTALDLTSQIPNVAQRSRLLRTVSSHIEGFKPDVLYPCWREMLRRSASRTRDNLLFDLAAASPMIVSIAGDSAVSEIAGMMEEAGRRWP